MVWTDPVSQDVDALRRLSDYHGVPILAVHAPCLLITQRVWGTDPWVKLRAGPRRPPSSSARGPSSCTRRSGGSGTTPAASPRHRADGGGAPPSGFAVENMFPLRARGREVSAYAPGLGPDAEPATGTYTLDLSPHRDRRLGRPRADGGRWATGSPTCTSRTAPARRRTSTWCRAGAPSRAAELLERLAARGFGGTVVRRGQHPAGGEPRGAGGRPGRGARLHPPAPRRSRPATLPRRLSRSGDRTLCACDR